MRLHDFSHNRAAAAVYFFLSTGSTPSITIFQVHKIPGEKKAISKRDYKRSRLPIFHKLQFQRGAAAAAVRLTDRRSYNVHTYTRDFALSPRAPRAFVFVPLSLSPGSRIDANRVSLASQTDEHITHRQRERELGYKLSDVTFSRCYRRLIGHVRTS